MRPLEPRERRILALGLLIGVLGLFWLGAVSPVLGGFQARAQRRQDLLAEYQANQDLLASIGALQRGAAEQRRSAALYQITAPSPGVAAEALKQRLAATLTAAGGNVGAVQPVQAGVPAGWVSARADAQIGLPQLVAALRQLENETAYVVVQYLSIEADRAASLGRAAPLDIRIQVSALVRPAAAPAR
jgi:general secretion pathway protein M